MCSFSPEYYFTTSTYNPEICCIMILTRPKVYVFCVKEIILYCGKTRRGVKLRYAIWITTQYGYVLLCLGLCQIKASKFSGYKIKV